MVIQQPIPWHTLANPHVLGVSFCERLQPSRGLNLMISDFAWEYGIPQPQGSKHLQRKKHGCKGNDEMMFLENPVNYDSGWIIITFHQPPTTWKYGPFWRAFPGFTTFGRFWSKGFLMEWPSKWMVSLSLCKILGKCKEIAQCEVKGCKRYPTYPALILTKSAVQLLNRKRNDDSRILQSGKVQRVSLRRDTEIFLWHIGQVWPCHRMEEQRRADFFFSSWHA